MSTKETATEECFGSPIIETARKALYVRRTPPYLHIRGSPILRQGLFPQNQAAPA